MFSIYIQAHTIPYSLIPHVTSNEPLISQKIENNIIEMKNQLFFFAIITLLVVAKKFEARFLLIELNDETEAKPSHGRGLGLGRSKIIYLSL